MGWLKAIFGVLVGAFIGALIQGMEGWARMIAVSVLGGFTLLTPPPDLPPLVVPVLTVL